ncbi:MAG: cell division protein SepF [Leptolyngbyaceae bacterium]|nr:cell division protein SepF [Leptolyngbyaceae bacterium]
MSNIFGRLRDFVGLNDPAEYDYEYDEMEEADYQEIYHEDHVQPAPEEEMPRRRRFRERAPIGESPIGGSSNVIGMPGALNGMSEVMVMEPRSFEEMPQVIRALRERKSVVLNLTLMDPDQAQRSVDFVAGGTYAIDGHQERIGESIFLFTPNCVQVSTQMGVMNEVHPHIPVARPVPQSMVPEPSWVAEQQVRMA